MTLDFGLTNGLFTNSDLLSTNSKMWTTSGLAFNSSDSITYHLTTPFYSSIVGTGFTECSFPDGVSLTSAVVYGNDTTSDWYLYSVVLGTGVISLITSGKIGTEVDIKSSDIVDNSSFSYVIKVVCEGLVYGAKVTYSL